MCIRDRSNNMKYIKLYQHRYLTWRVSYVSRKMSKRFHKRCEPLSKQTHCCYKRGADAVLVWVTCLDPDRGLSSKAHCLTSRLITLNSLGARYLNVTIKAPYQKFYNGVLTLWLLSFLVIAFQRMVSLGSHFARWTLTLSYIFLVSSLPHLSLIHI